MRHPLFNTARGGAIITSKPPYDFEGVTGRIFPIKANVFRLRKFCEGYYNLVPPEIAHFEPALPYVFVMVLNYGKLSQEASNAGWVAQNELVFGVLMEWYRKENGRYVFQDWALGSPFIFVDDEQSLTTGREVYGWPKVKGWLDPGISPWALHPRNSRRLLNLKARMFPKMSEGEAQKPCTLLEIYQEPPQNVLQLPPELRNPLNPLLAIPEALLNTARLAGDVGEMLLRPKILGYEMSASVRSLWERLRKLLRIANAVNPDLYSNCINLKQFRDSEQPSAACYQALTNSRMEINRFNRAGLLGETAILRGDFSGGYRLRIHKYDAQPIVDSLGLEVDSWGDETGGSGFRQRITEGRVGNTRLIDRERSFRRDTAPQPVTTVATLKPVFPFWCDLDMRYSLGKPIAWRTRRSAWYALTEADDPEAEAAPSETAVEETAAGAGGTDHSGTDHSATEDSATEDSATGDSAIEDSGSEETRSEDSKAPDCQVEIHRPEVETLTAEGEASYNTARGAAVQSVSGPFTFPNTTVRVFPLLADPERLKAFCDSYLNLAPGVATWEPWGRYVYLTVTNYGEMSSESNDVGLFADRDLAFTLPLKWKNGDGELISLSVVSPFVYSDSGIATTSGREVMGWPVTKAAIESPPDAWMSEGGAAPTADRQLLHLRMRLIPALDRGLGAQDRVVLEIIRGAALPFNDPVESREVAGNWGKTLVDELKRKVSLAQRHREELQDLKAMAIELLALRAPIHHVNLKQFRDCSEPDQACYQALVKTSSRFEFVEEICEIEDPIHILIHRYPTQPIVEMLGLRVKKTEAGKSPFPGRVWEGAAIDYLQPIRPFWMKLKLRTDLGRNLCWRSEPKPWLWYGSLPGPHYFEEGPRVGPGLVAQMEAIDKARLVPKLAEQQWRKQRETGRGFGDQALLDRERAKEVVETLDPQLALESILSAGWLRYQPAVDRKADFCLRWDSLGLLSDELVFQIKNRDRRRFPEKWHKEGDWVWLEGTPMPAAAQPFEDEDRQALLVDNLSEIRGISSVEEDDSGHLPPAGQVQKEVARPGEVGSKAARNGKAAAQAADPNSASPAETAPSAETAPETAPEVETKPEGKPRPVTRRPLPEKPPPATKAAPEKPKARTATPEAVPSPEDGSGEDEKKPETS